MVSIYFLMHAPSLIVNNSLGMLFHMKTCLFL